ncbi:MAG: hypothetical protein HYU52_09150 [Acidobacteria bacterium]|nr:hypothetical protein [Acidobacteriota bacterium]
MNEEKPLSPAQAQYVLNRLVEDGLISARDVARYLASMQGEIRALENRLVHLRSLSTDTEAPVRRRRGRRGRRAAAGRPRAAGAAVKPAAPAKAAAALSPKQRTSRQLQGVYMSLIRQFPKSKRAAIKALAKEKDRQAAVDMMQAALAKKK